MNKINQKNFWRIYGCFLGILVVLFMSLWGINLITKQKWESGLKKNIQTVITANLPDNWILGNPVPLNSPYATSACLFELRNKDNAEKYYAIIIRITTLYGHMPAVFIYNKSSGPVFVGYSAVQGRIKRLLEENNSDSSISYWLEKIPRIIDKAEEAKRK